MMKNNVDLAKKVLPTNNLAFKYIFCGEGSEEIIREMVSLFFGFTPKEVEIGNPASIHVLTHPESHIRLAETIKDLKVRIDDDTFIMEMQNQKEEFFFKRAVFYFDDAYMGKYKNYPRSEIRYSSLSKVYALNILNHNMFDAEQAIHTIDIHDFKVLKYLELGKESDEKPVRDFQRFMKMGISDENADKLIKMMQERMDYINNNSEVREFMNMGEMVHYYDTMNAINEGRAKGMAEGEKEVALKLLKKGMSRDEIAEVTSLSKEEVEKLAIL